MLTAIEKKAMLAKKKKRKLNTEVMIQKMVKNSRLFFIALYMHRRDCL